MYDYHAQSNPTPDTWEEHARAGYADILQSDNKTKTEKMNTNEVKSQ